MFISVHVQIINCTVFQNVLIWNACLMSTDVCRVHRLVCKNVNRVVSPTGLWFTCTGLFMLQIHCPCFLSFICWSFIYCFMLYLHPDASHSSNSTKWRLISPDQMTIGSGPPGLYSTVSSTVVSIPLNPCSLVLVGLYGTMFIVLMAGLFTAISSHSLWLISVRYFPSNLLCL